MKLLIKFEELGLFILSVFVLYKFGMPLPWWLYLILFFSPDIGMLGYLINTAMGAFFYNLLHHKGIACVLIIIGVVYPNDYVLLAGLIMLAHAAFDRILGYGLKYNDDFKHTSAGYI